MSQSIKTAGKTAYLDPLHSVGYLARINFRVFSAALEQLTLPFGVSAGQWRLLRVLWETDNITQRELSERAGTKEATTVHAVRSLISADLVTQSRCTVDGRKRYIRLTPHARRLRAKLMPLVAQVNEQALAGIDPAHVAIARQVLATTHSNLCTRLEAIDD